LRKIYYELDIGYCGCDDKGIIEVGDDMSDADIDDMVHEMALEHAASWEGDERLGFSNPDDFEGGYDSDEYQQEVDNFYDNVCGSWRDATPEDLENYS
jgi:hypothetical protein